MIARLLPDGSLYDQEALSVDLGLSVRTVRRRCEPVACDVASRAPLYDPDAAGEVLASVRARPARAVVSRRLRVA